MRILKHVRICRTKSGHAAVLGRARGSQQAAAPEDEKVQEVALRKETKTCFNKSSETGVGNAAEKGIKEHNKSIILDAQDALSRWRRE